MNNQLNTNKEYTLHCKYNTIKLKIPIPCKKCDQENRLQSKLFDNCKSLYQHLLFFHSRNDKLEQPTRDDCIKELQKLSDSMEMLKQ